MPDKSQILWAPSQQQIDGARMTEFSRFFSARISKPKPSTYAELHRASIEHPGPFWRTVWDFCIPNVSSGGSNQTSQPDFIPGSAFENGRWFPQDQLNFAAALMIPEQLSEPDIAGSIAIVSWNESGLQSTMTRSQLFEQVRSLAGYFHHQGVGVGDRIAAVLPNIPEAIIAMLAAASLGAIWSSCSPDFGDDAICDRFGQIQPKLIVTAEETFYNGKRIEPANQVRSLLSRLPSVANLVVVGGQATQSLPAAYVSWSSAIEMGETVVRSSSNESFQSVFLCSQPFAHPLYIVYSSGTTGVPKCIVHGAGGSLLQHVKEHQLHCDLRKGDRLFFYTTTGWMMWNWLASGLASGAALVLYDGSPFVHGPSTLWEMVEKTRVTHFGAGARYYATQEKAGFRPKDRFDLSAIRCVMSTGSPLTDSTFDWIYSTVASDLNLASISGGTDLLSCFVLGNPTLPVRRGEIQCKGLGMDVHVFDHQGQAVIDTPGELVCTSPFPSMPVGFWNDVSGEKYHKAYFGRYPNCWHHGDWVKETSHGSFIIFGRSDATLNPGGVRIGTAEIYQQLESLPEIVESIATVLRSDGDEQIVLFVRLAEGSIMTPELSDSIRKRLREHCSPRHVPAIIQAAPDLPRTISGKLSEIAVRNAISGSDLGNSGALANPQSLKFFENWKPNS